MSNQEGLASVLTDGPDLAGARNVDTGPLLPSQPKTVADTGLDRLLLGDLVVKALHLFGRTPLAALRNKLKLSLSVLDEILRFLVAERLCEVVRRGATDIDVEYQLTLAGKQRAADALALSRYVGPAPVTLDAYQAMVTHQSMRHHRVDHRDLDIAFAGMVLPERLRTQVGTAINSSRPLFLYGPAGSGKSFLAEKLSRLMKGWIAIPYAITVENEIIQFFDPLVHHVLAEPEQGTTPMDVLLHEARDARWLRCTRPAVLTGGELTLEALELRYDYQTGFYHAPPHLKANNGVFIVDDLGRQRVAPHEQMNRWIVPLDRGCDYLSLHTGYKFAVPFDLSVVFSTNLDPAELADESFLRRLGYKIHVGELARDDYRRVFLQHAYALGIEFDEAAFLYLVECLHPQSGRRLLACYARDLLRHVVDFARFSGEAAVMDPGSLDRAWHSCFSATDNPAGSMPPPPAGALAASGIEAARRME